MFVGDESLEREIIDAVRSAGFPVYAITEELPGISDTAVLSLSVARNEPLITNDKDFGELIFRDRLSSVGVVLLRLPSMTPDERAMRVVDWLRLNSTDAIHCYVVISRETARVRRLRLPYS